MPGIGDQDPGITDHDAGIGDYVRPESVITMLRNTQQMIDPANPQHVRAAGQKVLDKIAANGWDEIEYFFVSSRWATSTRKVAGMAPVMRVSRVIW
jgi:hypothetical protein